MRENLGIPYPKPSWAHSGGVSTAVASQAITVTSTATKQFAAFNDITDFVMLDIQGGDVLLTVDSATPAANTAHLLYNRTNYTWSKAMALAAKFVANTTTNVVIVASELQQ